MKDVKNNNNNSITLHEWVSVYHPEEEMRDVFLNIDRAMKYVHDHNYCIKSFIPKDIEILNGSSSQIRFKTLLELPDDQILRKKYIKEDIYNSSFIQVGLYSKCLNYLKKEFLEENFDSFTTFIPSGDVPYYRGVIERGASVYLCEYDLEKRKRDLINLEKEFGNDNQSVDSSKMFKKADLNEEINSVIYRQITKKNDSAYINYLIYPTLVFTMLIIISLLVRIFFV